MAKSQALSLLRRAEIWRQAKLDVAAIVALGNREVSDQDLQELIGLTPIEGPSR